MGLSGSRMILATICAGLLCQLPLLSVTGCGHPAKDPAVDSPDKGKHSMAKAQPGNQPIIGTIDSLCDWLTEEPRSAQSAAQKLGAIESEGSSAVYVEPASGAFSKAIISRETDSSDTSYIELSLAEPGAVTVAELEAKYGEYTEPPRVHFDSPAAIHFFVDRGPDRPLTCLVVAKIDEGEAGISDGTVKELAVRVDPR